MSIIGIVVALTIPSLILKNREKETVVQLKKVYNVFSNVFALAEAQYGSVGGWYFGPAKSIEAAQSVYEKIAPNLSVVKYCGVKSDCFANNMYAEISGANPVKLDDWVGSSKAVLADGTIMLFQIVSSDCSQIRGSGEKLKHSCGVLFVDINGQKGPNRNGMDYFEFILTAYGLVPNGTYDTTWWNLNSCRASGVGCTAWVLQKENLDYLKHDISWDE